MGGEDTHGIDFADDVPVGVPDPRGTKLAAVSSSANARGGADDTGGGPPSPGPYLQTVSGRWVNPFDPDPDQIELSDIARALANQCRFGGHCRPFYSVAQHCVIVSELMEQEGGNAEDALAALMHDAPEAYLGDLPHPIKHRSPLGTVFREAEEPLDRMIRRRFSISDPSEAVKRIDRALLATERRAFSAEMWDWPELEGVESLQLELRAWSPDEAADAFIRRFEELDARRTNSAPG